MSHTRTLEHSPASPDGTHGRVRYTCSCGTEGNWYSYGPDILSSDDAETAAVEDGDEHLSDLA